MQLSTRRHCHSGFNQPSPIVPVPARTALATSAAPRPSCASSSYSGGAAPARAQRQRHSGRSFQLCPLVGLLLCSASVSGIRDPFGAMPELGRGCINAQCTKIWLSLHRRHLCLVVPSMGRPLGAFPGPTGHQCNPAAGRPALRPSLASWGSRVPIRQGTPRGTISLATRFFGSVMLPAQGLFPFFRPLSTGLLSSSPSASMASGKMAKDKIARPAPSPQLWLRWWRCSISSTEIQLINLNRDRLGWVLKRQRPWS